MRKKVIIIAVCLLLAAICTLVINRSTNSKYIEISKPATTWAAADYIPMGVKITEKHLKKIELPQHVAKKTGVVTNKEDIIGKSLYTPAFPDIPIYKKQVNPVLNTRKQGYKKIGIPVTQSSSDQVVAGDRVDIYPVSNDQYSIAFLEPIATDVYVLASYDQSGRVVTPYAGDVLNAAQSKVPSMVEVEVPDENVSTVVSYASSKQVYLVRR